MPPRKRATPAPNIFFVAQNGRLAHEAVILAASLRATNPDYPGKIFAGEPQPGPMWKGDPRIPEPQRKLLEGFGVTIVPIENMHFGQSYPHGNKIEGLFALPKGEPFLFLDTDTLVTGDLTSVAFDFDRPSASMRREGTWPVIELYGPGYNAIWKSLYDRFGLDFASSLDLKQPDEHWERYLYFNAGWFFFRCPHEFGARFLSYALSIRDDTPEELVVQSLDPWLDQVALPLVIHSFGGGRPGKGQQGLDGDVTCHYRLFPLLYARESDRVVEVLEEVTAPNPVKKVLKEYEPLKKIVYQGKGKVIRAMFNRADLPRREAAIRSKIKAAKLWLR